MARIDDVKRENLSPRQQQLHDDFLKSRPRNTLTIFEELGGDPAAVKLCQWR